MPTLAPLKAVVVVSALAMGAAAVALVVAVQRNPYKFTNLDGKLATPAAAVTVAAQALPVAIEMPRAIPQPVAEAARTAVESTPRKLIRAARQPVSAAPAPEDTKDKVVAAPCVEGEYRQIEEHRGVRMICPGSDAMAPAEPEEP